MSRSFALVENGRRVISTHRTLASAVRRELALQRECKRANGENTWRDLLVRWDDGSCCGGPLTREERERAATLAEEICIARETRLRK